VLDIEGDPHLVLWPPDTTWSDVTGTIELDGIEVREGDTISLTGGEFPAGDVGDPRDWVTRPSDDCLAVGKVWRASGIVPP
jgi:hypothetical protein